MKLPDFLKKAITDNTTSLGDHHAFPPEEEETFISFILQNQYNRIMEPFEGKEVSIKEISKRLNELIIECQKIEATNKEAL